MAKVYHFKKFDATAGDYVHAPRMATPAAIEGFKAVRVAESETDVDDSLIDGNGFYCPDGVEPRA
jgi:hypothetical protein